MVRWRLPAGVGLMFGGLLALAAGGLQDVWWSWVLGGVVALVGVFGGMGLFFAGLMRE